jgi:hypothetical protein
MAMANRCGLSAPALLTSVVAITHHVGATWVQDVSGGIQMWTGTAWISMRDASIAILLIVSV